MADNVNFNRLKGKHSFVSAKEVPWHRLGQLVDGRMTSRECMEQALLDYEVDKGKVYVKYNEPINDRKTVVLKDKFITYRTDTGDSFSMVGNNYEVIQNREAFEFFDSIVGERRAIYETAGALGKGEIVFITAKLPDHILIGGKDTIDQYLLLTMSHDGSSSIIAKFTPIRVVCNNTLSAALSRGSNIFKIRHTASARDRMVDAQKLLALTYKNSKQTQEVYEHLTKIKITDEVKEDFFLNIFLTKDEYATLVKEGVAWYNSDSISTRKKNQLAELYKYDNVGPGQDFDICKGTAYGAYNTLAGYFQNVKNFSNDEKKFQSIILGTDGTVLQNSLNFLTQLG